MAYSPKSQKKYNDKCNRIYLKYSEKEMQDYDRIVDYCNSNNYAISTYIKGLIKRDLDNKGVPYEPDNVE